ncbi:hypothetical protein ILUMI_00953 [Ignelater luminosus]|uniref:Uncharacterized protein n=1 Tax=Ignelater luminosus TaxID=2038154 RepID=A0A8K0DG91_IGNLU|nr:hypothetical protein ILUMI_00953 [Ignelater luminosus]
MDLPSVIYPPNKPLERPLALSKTPVSYNYMFFVDVNEKGEFIAGCSNINGSYWENVLYHYKDVTSANVNHYSGYYIGSSTSADAKFIASNKVILAEDNSCLKLLTIKDNGNPTLLCEEVLKTNDRVEQMSVWNNTHKVLACADSTVLIADMQSSSLNPVTEFKDFHTQFVTSVDVNKNQVNLFASASIDRKACIWDDRMSITASVLYQNEFSGLTSINWNQIHPECLVVGNESGDIYSLDIRQPNEVLCSHSCFNTRIHRSVFNNSGYLAVCGDTCELLILNGNDNLNVIYKSSDHSGFVRGLAWFHETLYSCGFDKQIIKHVF